MPLISDKNVVEAIAREYCSNGHVKSLALQNAGYSVNYSEHTGLKLFDNDRVKAAVQAETKRLEVKIEYDYETAIKELDQVIDNLALQAKNGNISANSALTQAIREKNAITGLHKQTIKTEAVAPQLNESEKAVLEPLVRDFKRGLVERN